jgi:hypothetical protein
MNRQGVIELFRRKLDRDTVLTQPDRREHRPFTIINGTKVVDWEEEGWA